MLSLGINTTLMSVCVSVFIHACDVQMLLSYVFYMFFSIIDTIC